MKSILVHLMNKFYGCDVSFSDGRIVVRKDGELLVCALKGAHGAFEDRKDLGAKYELCLSPIPREARVYKLCKKNTVCLDEKAEERKVVAKAYVDKFGYVPCMKDIEEKNLSIDKE